MFCSICCLLIIQLVSAAYRVTDGTDSFVEYQKGDPIIRDAVQKEYESTSGGPMATGLAGEVMLDGSFQVLTLDQTGDTRCVQARWIFKPWVRSEQMSVF